GVKVGHRSRESWVKVLGKNYLPYELMLLFADDGLFINQSKRALSAEHELQESDVLLDTESIS
ncbi:MAG: hypothetical protein ACTICI_14530, partial [Brevibacterium aurantiacum]